MRMSACTCIGVLVCVCVWVSGVCACVLVRVCVETFVCPCLQGIRPLSRHDRDRQIEKAVTTKQKQPASI